MEKDSWGSRFNGKTNAVIGSGESAGPKTEFSRAVRSDLTKQTTSCDLVPQWGNRKRLRCMKTPPVKDDSPGPVHRSTVRFERQAVRSEKDASNQQPTTATGNNTHPNGYFNLRQRPHSLQPPAYQRVLRNSENSGAMRGQSNGGAHDKRSAHYQKSNGNDNNTNHTKKSDGSSAHDSKKAGGGGSSSGGSGEAAVPAIWPPKFMIGLTNKEKEEDFWVLKGSKLPQRPKKRAKFIQRTLNLVSPGTWLCDLTLERYEVREKKVSKKRPRGLKAMSNLESESE